MPTNKLGLATAMTLVDADKALMAAAMEIALETLLAEVVVAWVDVSELDRGAFTVNPLITRSLPVRVIGADVDPERLAVVYWAEVEE